ncbi:hypothetical protein EDD86DRAFT_248055 [Gorgonomyces haynaldii]|nr:hypothetical protein EDD86DRAFT_248055 [Gorgonomyces haynaldii]
MDIRLSQQLRNLEKHIKYETQPTQRHLNASSQSLQHLRELEAFQSQSKHHALIEYHKTIWIEEYRHLNASVSKIEFATLDPVDRLRLLPDEEEDDSLLVQVLALKNNPPNQKTLREIQWLKDRHQQKMQEADAYVEALEKELKQFHFDNDIDFDPFLDLKQDYDKSREILKQLYPPVQSWNDHALFLKIREEYMRHHQPPRRMLERLSLEMPHYSIKQFSSHLLQHQQRVAYRQHLDALYTKTVNAIQAFCDADEQEMLQKQEEMAKNYRKELEKKTESMEKLKIWRQQRMQQMQLVQEQQEREQQLQQDQLREIQEQERLRRQHNQQKLEQHYQKLQEHKRMQQEMIKKLAFQEQAEKILNEERILYRKQKRHEKLKQRERELERVQQEKLQDWERILDDTASYSIYRQAAKEEKNWYQPDGFSQEKLFKDKRFIR